MMEFVSQIEWDPSMIDPAGTRQQKPRTAGLTMVIDKGLGLHAYEDLIETAGAYIDIMKMGFGTASLYPQSILERKIEAAKNANIRVIPGGTFLELAVKNEQIRPFFNNICALGFDGIEVSDGTIELERITRNELIREGLANGLTVFTEYGKKAWGSTIEWEDFVHTMYMDLECGAQLITVEGRESGKGVGLFDASGNSNYELIAKQIRSFARPDAILFEAPLKTQQVELLKALGRNVNLGNIAADSVLALECLRRGLRSDTFLF